MQYILFTKSIKEQSERGLVRVFPNPVSQQSVTVDLPESMVATVKLVNIHGVTVTEFETALTQRFTMPLPDVPSGVYVLQIIDQKTKHTYIKKLIVI